MPNKEIIPGSKIKQVFMIITIVGMLFLIIFNLKLFIPSVLGAITLYVISRKYNFYLQEEKNWKPSLAASLIMVATLVVLILPIYFIVDLLIDKLGNAEAYMAQFNAFLDKIHDFVMQKVHIDILSKENLDKVKSAAGKFSGTALSGTFNTLTIILSM